MKPFQDRINAFFERFQDRWDSDQAFRATWSLVIGAVLALMLLVCLVGTIVNSGNIAAAIFGNPTATLPPDTGQRGDAGAATFAPAPLTPAASSPSNPPPQTVNGTSTSPPTPTVPPTPPGTPPASPTPTLLPGQNTPTPSMTDGTATPTPSASTANWTVQQQPVIWRPGQTGQIIFTSDTSQAQKLLVIQLDFGNGCKYGPVTAQLRPDGGLLYSFTVPNCVRGGNINVKGTFSIQNLQMTATFTAIGP